ncbi:MAG TPA: efflux RND transporter periplasmic adaptor subunit [Gemmatimonadales bacterium]|nr:efflux RND transporter periplasmic adaptor subunit [Gemmatimonadales bacterium]
MNPSSPFHPAHSRKSPWAGLLAATAVTAVLIWQFAAPPAPPPAASHAGGHSVPPAAAGPAQVTLGGPEQRAIGITFAAVERAPLEHIVRSAGIVAYDETRVTTVTSKVEGWVESLTIDFTGEQVARGQSLLVLYAPEVVTAQQELLLGLRLVSELRDGDPAARRSADEMVAASRRRLLHWDVPAAEIAAVETGGVPSRTVSLRARAPGFAVEKNVEAGQRVMPGDPLYRVADLRVVWIEGAIYERDLPLIRSGAAARVEFTALPGVERRGKVSYIAPIVDPDTRTVRIRVEVANPDFTLRPGMYAALEVESLSRITLSIPRTAALVTGKRTLVFLKRPGGRFEPREVTLGTGTDERYEVLSGLVAGDTVVASGTFLLDAESNLGTLLGGMGGMPGMDMAPPAPPVAPAPHQHR